MEFFIAKFIDYMSVAYALTMPSEKRPNEIVEALSNQIRINIYLSQDLRAMDRYFKNVSEIKK